MLLYKDREISLWPPTSFALQFEKLELTIFTILICKVDEAIPNLIQRPKLSGAGSAQNRVTMNLISASPIPC